MIVTHIILTISMIAWFLTIFRQKNGSIYLYFLILGLMDPLGLFAIYVLKIPSAIVFSLGSILILFALRTDNFKSIKFRILDYLVLFAFIASFFIQVKIFPFALFAHVFILINFVQRVIIPLHSKGELNIYFSLLVFYEMSLLIKGIVFASGAISGVYLSYSTLAFQILIAIFFIIFTEDSPKLIIKLIPSE